MLNMCLAGTVLDSQFAKMLLPLLHPPMVPLMKILQLLMKMKIMITNVC